MEPATMARTLLLGVDVGTSAVKAALFEPEGRLVAMARAACRPDSPRPGWSETPPQRWWNATREALAALGPRVDDAAGLGLSVLFPALIALDARGRPLRPAILYNDQRSAHTVARLGPRRAAIERLTGNRLAPGTCSLSSLLWLREHEPAAYRNAAVFGHVDTFLVHKLAGVFAMDRGNASLSGLVELGREERFSQRLCRLAGVDPERLPRLLRSADTAGGVTRAAARATGLRSGTPVAAGTGDAVAAVFGAGVIEPGCMLCVLGSSDNAAVVSRAPNPNPHACNTAHCVDGRWVSISTATSTGAAVDWFARAVLKAEPAELLRQAAKSPPGARGVLFLPYLQGERTPVWDPGARGAFAGLSAATTQADLARAVIEGAAFAFRQIAECQGRARRIVAVGGGARARLAVQVRATALGRPIEVMDFSETPALGAAMLAGVAAGVYPSAAAAVAATQGCRKCRVVSPVPEWRRAYRERFEAYAGLYPRLKGLA